MDDAHDPASELGALRRRHAELEVLFQTVRDLGSTLSSHEVIERLVERTLRHLDSEIASVLRVEPDDTLRIIHAVGLPETVVRSTRVRVGEGIAGHVAASGEPLLVADVERDPRFERRNHERYYTRSCISAPLRDQGRVRGVLNVNNKRCRAPYRDEDLRLLGAIATHAAVALRNADRFEEVLERAQRDPLTGLANHGHFWTVLEIEVRRALRHGRPLGLVLVDVDHFKAFNDGYGHVRGDRALAAVAGVLAQRCRAHDLPARYGGEEFAVILPETGSDGAEAFGEKVRLGVEGLGVDTPGEGSVLTVSVGASTLGPGTDEAAGLVEAADAQLYRAKEAGRNRVCAG